MKKVLAALIVLLIVGGGTAAATEGGRKNDHVLRGDRKEYIEYFKQDERGGDKNYLYTVTHQKAPAAGECDIYTFDSEKYALSVCNMPGGSR